MIFSRQTSSSSLSILLLLLSSISSAHIVITYPGWRGDNLNTNGTDEQFAQSGGLGVGPNNTYPYGMQWMYPCTSSQPSSIHVLIS